MRWKQSLWSNVQSFLLYVFFHILANKSLDGALGPNSTANFCGRNFLVHVVEQVQRDTGKHKITCGRLLGKRFCDFCSRPEFFWQRASHISQREPWPASDDKFALGK